LASHGIMGWPAALSASATIGSSPVPQPGEISMRFVVAGASGAYAARRWPLLACAGIVVLLSACGQENKFVAPPPPKVTIQLALQQDVTPFLEATGNTAAINTVKLVARVQGYVQEIKYQDGMPVKK